MASGLRLEETELRLGLPGGGGGGEEGGGETAATKNPGKRGFEETIDLKLQLQTPAADVKEAEAAGEKANEPPAPKAQVVGWPPVRSSFRKNILSVVKGGGTRSKSMAEEEGEDGPNAKPGGGSAPAPAACFVKVSMDGAPYLRKVDLRTQRSYQDLSVALHKMFATATPAAAGGGMGDEVTKESEEVMDGCDYVTTYRDKDGDWMLVGDVPWEMFVDSCKRLRLMKGSEAIGFGAKGTEKCKKRI